MQSGGKLCILKREKVLQKFRGYKIYEAEIRLQSGGKLCILKREKVLQKFRGYKIYEADKARAQAGTR